MKVRRCVYEHVIPIDCAWWSYELLYAVPQKSHALVLLILKRVLLIFSAMLETINSRSLLFLSQYFDLLNGLRNYDVLMFSRSTHLSLVLSLRLRASLRGVFG